MTNTHMMDAASLDEGSDLQPRPSKYRKVASALSDAESESTVAATEECGQVHEHSRASCSTGSTISPGPSMPANSSKPGLVKLAVGEALQVQRLRVKRCVRG